VNGAAKAFTQAQEAMLGGDTARAADLYELADELAPSAPALRNATRARLAAGHLAMAATNAATLLRRYPSDKESRDIAEAILSRLAPQLAQLDVACAARCTLLIDGKVIASVPREQHSLFAQPGARTITAAFDDGRKASNQVTALVNHITSVRFEAPARPIASTVVPKAGNAGPAGGGSTGDTGTRSAGGLSRWWVIGGGAVTLGAGVATLVSGLATLSTRDKIRGAVAAGDTASATSLYNTGRDQQTRTNVLLGVTAAAGVATVVLAVFTNWSGAARAEERNLAIVPSSGSLSLVYGGQY
jgi:X-X-X-Leu-X-X-Gly heptad repeat protein